MIVLRYIYFYYIVLSQLFENNIRLTIMVSFKFIKIEKRNNRYYFLT